MTIEVLICTINEGIEKVSQVVTAPIEGVSWLVSFQYTENKWLDKIPDALKGRDDVRIIPIEGKGLSKNRNNALAHALGDLLVIADDDTHFEKIYFERILHTFSVHSNIQIACFQAENLDGKPLRAYPDYTFKYENTPKGFWYNSIGIVMRNIPELVRFDERFGLGAPYLGCGEEEVFLWDAFTNGLYIRYVPEVVAQTAEGTTSDRFYEDESLQRAKGAVLYCIHGRYGAYLRCFKFALCNSKGHNKAEILRNLLAGIKFMQQ